MLKAPLMHPNRVITEGSSCSPQLLLPHCWSAAHSNPSISRHRDKVITMSCYGPVPCEQKYYRRILHHLPALKTLHHWLMKFNNYLRICAFPGAFNFSYFNPPFPAFASLLHMFQPHLGLFSLIQLFLFELYSVGQIVKKRKTCPPVLFYERTP